MSDDMRRLEAQARAGDIQAAGRLRQLWRRAGHDPADRVGELLDRALGDDEPDRFAALTAIFKAPAASAERLATCWAATDRAPLTRALRAFGVVLESGSCEAVEARLDRLASSLAIPAPLELPLTALICAALDADGIGWSHLATDERALVALAVVRRVRRVVVLAVGTCAAESASPGRVWRKLQPWREGSDSLTARCANWALATRHDRVVLPWVEPSGAVVDALGRVEVPVATRDALDVLLDDKPSQALFDKIVRHIEGLDRDAAEPVAARAREELTRWSTSVRCGGSRWLGALASARQRGAHGLGLQLVTRLELAGGALRTERLDALIDSGQASMLRELHVTVMSARDLERFMDHAPWTQLERATIAPRGVGGVAGLLVEHQADFLARVEQLSLNNPRAFARDPGPWLQLRVGDGEALGALLAACPRLYELRLADGAAAQAFARVAEAAAVDGVTQLWLDCSTEEAVEALCARAWPALHGLELQRLSAGDSRRLGEHDGLSSVRVLRLHGREVLDLEALVGSSLITGLHHLALGQPDATAEAILALLSDPGLAELRELHVPLEEGDAVAAWLESAPRFPALERLGVRLRRWNYAFYRRLRGFEHLANVEIR